MALNQWFPRPALAPVRIWTGSGPDPLRTHLSPERLLRPKTCLEDRFLVLLIPESCVGADASSVSPTFM